MRVKSTTWRKLGVSLFIIGAIFTFFNLQTEAAEQSDAIAVRVMPNPNHDSIDIWYAKQGFRGSPQSLVVDGYEAIRDGRTVFVNAANLDKGLMYTNIYLISYNQDPGVKTGDILGQLVSHWKFNNNVVTPGFCSISKQNCQADADCATDYICSNTNSMGSDHGEYSNNGKCILKKEKQQSCIIDSDCPVNLFCDSLKAKTIRDVKRLGVLNQIKEAIDKFKVKNGNYPGLSSGTYISGKTISIWPSWTDTLFSQLGLSQSLVDPINSLGACTASYDAITCWNKERNEFWAADLTLPYGSHAFIYKATQNGVNYDLCSVFETKGEGYNTAEGQLVNQSCAVSGTGYSGTNSNTAPKVISSYTDGETGKEFNGYIKVKDAEGDKISWSLQPLTGWNSPVFVRDTGDANQKKLYAVSAPATNTYTSKLTLTDSRGAISTTTLTFNISAANKPKIEASDVDYFVDPVNPLKYVFYVQGSNSVPKVTFVSDKMITDNLKIISNTTEGLNRSRVEATLLIPTKNLINKNVTIPLTIKATEGTVVSTRAVNINLKIEQPYLNFQCEDVARLGSNYQLSGAPCLLGKAESGNHDLWYSVKTNGNNLSIDSSHVSENGIYLTASKVGTSSEPVQIDIKNEYGATSSKSFNLKVNTFCGDGIKQNPNSENRGGLYNNGVEQCDGSQGIQTASISTSSEIQYGCTNGPDKPAIYPIVDTKSCVFKPADDGGGYCGDGYCQFTVDGRDIENCWNCRQDCGTCLATVSSIADYVQSTFYNGQLLYKTVTPASDKKTISLASGKNVFGFWSHFLNNTPSIGLSFKVTMGANGKIFKEFNTYDKAPLLSCTTSGIANNNVYNPNYDPNTVTGSYANWNSLTYESTWASPYLFSTENKFQGLPYIWATGGNSGANDQIYCRLAFNYEPYSFDMACQPNCDGKQCGTDGCGGYCGENSTTNGTCNSKAKVVSSFQSNIFNTGATNIYKCFSQLCKCIPDCTNKICGGDGCGGYCGADSASGSCPGEYRISWGWNGTTWGNISMLKDQICSANGQCQCKPDCTNKNCGDDGCGGYCGTCAGNKYCNTAGQCDLKCGNKECGVDFTGTGYCGVGYNGACSSGGVCIDGKCTGVNTNIQVCADNKHTTYFNGIQVGSGDNWGVVTGMPASLKEGKNLLAIKATNNEGIYGFSATLNIKGDNNTTLKTMDTSTSTNWRCTDNSVYLESDWNSKDVLTQAWPVAKEIGPKGSARSPKWNGNALDYPMLWASNWVDANHTGLKGDVWCRYQFDINDIELPCTPSCAGKCGGSNGCGGFCPNTCVAPKVCGGDGTINTCAEKACLPNCNGKCGGSNGCGGTCTTTCPSTQDCVNNICTAKCVSDNSCSLKCGGTDNCGKTCQDNCVTPQTCGGSGIINKCGEATSQTTCDPEYCYSHCGGPDTCGGTCLNTCPSQRSCSDKGVGVNAYTSCCDSDNKCLKIIAF
jgi:hypothetical protein